MTPELERTMSAYAKGAVVEKHIVRISGVGVIVILVGGFLGRMCGVL